jgi:hypothetical protein
LSPGKSRGVAFLHLKAVACDGRWHPLTLHATHWNEVVG